MKKSSYNCLLLGLLILCGLSSWAQTPEISVLPTQFDVTLAHGDSAQYSLSVTNNTADVLPISVSGATLLSDKKMHIVALVNDADADQEYTNTIAAINTYFDNYTLTELNSFDAAVVANALANADVLLVPEQEDCNTVGWIGLAATVQDFANGGGTVIINGSINQCVFNLGLFSGLYLDNYNGATTLEAPSDPLLQGIVPPYTAQIVTYYYTIFDSDWTDVLTYQGNTVAGYRSIGDGKVILIGHDYMFSNTNMKRLIANAVSTANVSNQAWLYVSDDTDTLAANETIELTVEFNAKNRYAGVYTQALSVFAAANPNPVVVPCTLTVTGVAGYAINSPSHNFGDVPLSTLADYTFIVSNNGSADLVISDISAGSDAYLVSPDNATIAPTESQNISVTFAPPAVGTYNTSLTLVTNVGIFTAALNGNGIAAPSVSVSPTSISATLQSGENTTVPLTINNNGENTLNFSIDTTAFLAAPRILAYTYGIDLLGGYANIQAVLNAEFGSGYILTETNTTDPTELAMALVNADVFLVPPITDLNATTTFGTLSNALQNYANNGGNIIFLGSLLSLGQAPAVVSGLFSGAVAINPTGVCQVVMPAHPIVSGVPASFTPTSVNPISFDNADIVRIVTQPPLIPLLPQGDVVAYRNLGAGKAIYIGSDFSSYNNNDVLILANAIRWVTNAAVAWVSTTPDNGAVGYPNGTATINVTLDATGLAPGTYESTITISTNDPQNPTIDVPVTLTVLPGLPSAAFSANNTETCSGTVSFSDLSGGSPTAWQWDFGDGNSSTEQNPVYTYETDGTYSVSLTVCNDVGCTETTQIDYIEVGLSPDCAIATIPNNGLTLTTDCAGTLTDSGGSGNYLVGTQGAITIAPVGATFVELHFTSFNYTSSGLPIPIPGFEHTLTIYDGADTLSPIIGTYTGTTLPNGTGIILSSGGALTLKENTAGIFASILPAASGFEATWECQIITELPSPAFNYEQDTPCGSTIEFADASNQYPNAWQWDFGDGTTSTAESPEHTYAANGIYTVTLVACNIIGCSPPITQTVVIDDLISVDFNVIPTANINTPILLQTDFEGAALIEWDFGNGATAVDIPNPITFYSNPGTYTITLTVTNTNGCTATATHVLTIIDPSIGIASPDSPAAYLTAQPNPFAEQLSISLSDALLPKQTLSVSLYNVMGQRIYQSPTLSPQQLPYTINTTHLPAGLYYVALQSGDMRLLSKVVK
ncbi:MAG: PKD domain-containing protein [Sphingobacteriales bacterium]|nr:PKD domain-containing protein [Sphingobacteriales bacterium]